LLHPQKKVLCRGKKEERDQLWRNAKLKNHHQHKELTKHGHKKRKKKKRGPMYYTRNGNRAKERKERPIAKNYLGKRESTGKQLLPLRVGKRGGGGAGGFIAKEEERRGRMQFGTNKPLKSAWYPFR